MNKLNSEKWKETGKMVVNIPMDVPSPEEATLDDVLRYLNEILEYHGPPCEKCVHYSIRCEKSYRPRKYELELGPFSEWHIRNFCQDFQSKDEDEDGAIKTTVDHLMDSSSQQYG
jgi:hypothetical protein